MPAAQADVFVVGAEHDLLSLPGDAAFAVQPGVVRRLPAAPADGLDLLDGIGKGQKPVAAGEEVSLKVRAQAVADDGNLVFIHDANQQLHLLLCEELRLIHNQAVIGVRAHFIKVQRVKEGTFGLKARAGTNGEFAVAGIHGGLEQKRVLAALMVIVPDHDGVGGLTGPHRAIAKIQLCHTVAALPVKKMTQRVFLYCSRPGKG